MFVDDEITKFLVQVTVNMYLKKKVENMDFLSAGLLDLIEL